MFSTEQKARDSRNQQNKDDLNSFFSMSSTTQPPRRPGLSRRRETSPNPVPTPPADQNNYDWLGISTTKKDTGLPSWLLGPEDTDSNKTNNTKDENQNDKLQATRDTKQTQSQPIEQQIPNDQTLNMGRPAEPIHHQLEVQNIIPTNMIPTQSVLPAPNLTDLTSGEDPLIRDLQQSVGSIIDIKSYNRMIQDQTRMINMLISQQSRYMSQLVEKIGSVAAVSRDANVERDDLVGDADERIQVNMVGEGDQSIQVNMKLKRPLS
uniref:Uncharacterized protein n=1 Tax=Cacopsylla melanoneura TaxID=428564 RepID=A0A8D8WVP4_9HEMI